MTSQKLTPRTHNSLTMAKERRCHVHVTTGVETVTDAERRTRRCTYPKCLNLPVLVSLVILSVCNASLSPRTLIAGKHDRSPRTRSQRWPRFRSLSPSDSKSLNRGEFNSSHSTDQQDDALNAARNKINDALRRMTPGMVLGTAAAGGVLRHFHRNREATRRAIYFWSRVGPMVAHYRFAQWWLTATTANRTRRDRVYDTLHERYCHPSLTIILHLKGLYVKIGQVLSARPDFVPRQYVALFSTVQDAIPQWPIEHVHEIVKQELQSEYGLDWDDVFESMDPVALGSASIGQVHRAVLKSPWEKNDGYKGGKVVAVKVMHPGAKDRFRHDFQVFKWLCRVALPGWKPILVELERQIMTEFDYRIEANSLDQVRKNMQRTNYANKICLPEPLRGLCSKHLLVMQMLEGKKLSEAIEDKLVVALGGDRKLAHDFIKRKQEAIVHAADESLDFVPDKVSDLLTAIVNNENRTIVGTLFRKASLAIQLSSLRRQTREYVDLLINVHGHQIFLDGCFNGDPHPGNVLELSNGKLGLIDYGQTRRLTTSERLSFARVVLALSMEPMNATTVSDAMRNCGFETKFGNDEITAKYGALFFDDDSDSKRMGCATPQLYLMKLSSMDPLTTVPDAAVFVARTSWMFRGMGSMLDEQIRTSKRWAKHAQESLSMIPTESK